MKKNKIFQSLPMPKVGKIVLKLSTLSLSMLFLSFAHADENEDPLNTPEQPKKVQKVTVTGSSIKGVAAQSASPITIIKGEDLINQGVTTVEEALTRVSANQAGFSTSQNVGTSNTNGSTANLRGLGSDKTLVLINGRRVANSAFGTSETNLNIIPLAMVERIEVLRDGASAIYGADAVGGVINFITKKQYEGGGITVGGQIPEEKGGDKFDVSIFGGYGDLDEQGFNFYGVVDYRKQNTIWAKDRKVSRRGGVIPELGLDGSSANAFPANFYDPNGGPLDQDGNPEGLLGNPYADDCSNAKDTVADDGFCYLNTQTVIGIVPEQENLSALGRATFKLSDTFNLVGEYIYSRDAVTTSIAPDVYARSVTLPSSSPYYPGQGITPSVDGLSGDPLELYLRSQAGNRVSKSINESNRIFAGIEGEAYGWDINGGVTYAKSEATDSFESGYLNQSKVQDALNNGTLNPFGPQASTDADLWNTFDVNGDTNKASLESTTADITISRPIFKLPAGDVGFALGASFTDQSWEATVNSEIVAQVPGSGIDPNKPKSSGDRDITAVFTEFQIPLLSNLELQLAARYDDYSDFGDTFNPKVALRWEPMKKLMFRTSYSTGFRAPSLYEVNAPIVETWTGARYNDPVLCPDGSAIETRYQTECNTQFILTQGGNSDLGPEESKSYTVGFVFEPLKSLVFTADYYNIEIENMIGSIGEATIFNDPEKYASSIVRDSDGRIDHISTNLINTGGIKTQGIDLSLNYLSPVTSTGRWGFGMDGTYVIKMDYQSEKGGDWEGYVGLYANPAVVRWKHTANLNWSYENWRMIFEQQFTRGYEDYSEERDVGDYTVYNLSGTYKGFKNLELTAGVKNMFDAEPPASDVMDNFQYGYDPRYSDPTGRSYFLRGTYKF